MFSEKVQKKSICRLVRLENGKGYLSVCHLIIPDAHFINLVIIPNEAWELPTCTYLKCITNIKYICYHI